MPICETDWNGLAAGRLDFHLVGTSAVADLEAKLRQHYGMRYAVCVSNATTGLLAVALALNLRCAEFVTTPYTYGASLAGWLLLGNRPVFADIDPQTLTLAAEAIPPCITPRTKAILAVDIFGNPADMKALRQTADEYGLWYVADAAQSLGARREGAPASSLADALVVSFTVGKTLCAGEGGAILTNHAALYEKLVWFTQHPARQRRDLGLGLDNEFALNGRIHPAAAIGAATNFEKALADLQQHQQRCFELIEALNASGLTQQIEFRPQNIQPSFFRLTAAWRDRPARARIERELAAAGSRVEIVPPPVRLVYRQPAFLTQFARRLRKPPSCPVAELQARSRFCLVRFSSAAAFASVEG
jgi:dTDP-4-amino-4,6-dideoxygalactose transaminase